MSGDEYVLQRDTPPASVRLDAQHLLFKMQDGYILNPLIPVVEGMKIAEVGTGTAIWLRDLAGSLPKSAQLDGFDVSDAQFPAKKFLPQNLNLDVLDAFGEVPQHLVGKYDVVHLRFWTAIVKNNDVKPLIRHVSKLLKPGGYVQWEDGDLARTVTVGDPAVQAHSDLMKMFPRIGLSQDWLPNLPDLLADEGFQVLFTGPEELKQEVIPLCSSTYIMGIAEGSYFMLDQLGPAEGLPTGSQYRLILQKAFEDSKGDGQFYWTPIGIVAQKKGV